MYVSSWKNHGLYYLSLQSDEAGCKRMVSRFMARNIRVYVYFYEIRFSRIQITR